MKAIEDMTLKEVKEHCANQKECSECKLNVTSGDVYPTNDCILEEYPIHWKLR